MQAPNQASAGLYRAAAAMDIEVDDEDSLHHLLLDQCGRGDGDVIAIAWLDSAGS